MAGLLARGIELFWTGVAALVLAGATLIALIRLLLPELSTQRDAIAEWMGETVRRPMVMGTIEAEWRGWIPRIRVEGMTILDSSGQDELVRFETAVISIDPLGSISSGTLRPSSLIVSGVELTLIRDEQGRLSVAGMPPPKSPIIKWLIEQDNFAVTQADLTIIDRRAQTSFALNDLTVTVRNTDGRKMLEGRVELPAALGGHMQFVLDADSSPLESDWNGNLRIRLSDIDSAFLTAQLDWSGPPPPTARLELTAWTEWREARLTQADFELDARNPAAGADEPSALRAQGRVNRRTQGWNLSLANLDLPDAKSPAGLTVAWHTRDGIPQAVTARGAELPLMPLAVALGGLAPMTTEHRQLLLRAAPDGVLSTVELAWARTEAQPQYFLDAAFSNTWLGGDESLPGIEALDFELRMNASGGYAVTRDESMRIRDPERLVAPFDFDALNTLLTWEMVDGKPRFARLTRFEGLLNALEFRITGALTDPLESTRLVDLVIDVPRAEGPRLHELVPLGLLPARGERWTRSVFETGHVENLRVLLRGPLQRFPFRTGEGVFRAGFDVLDARLKYSHRWPVASGVSGHVSILGPTVHMDVAAGEVLGAELHDVNVEMPDLFVRERRLLMSGIGRGPGHTAAAIVMDSPLKAGKAARLADIVINGDIEVSLDMDLELFPGGGREVLGQARFAGNHIKAPKQRIELDEVTGVVSFTRSDWYGEGLTAVFDGTPVGLVLNGGLDDPNYDSEFRMTGTSTAAQFENHLQRYAPPVWRWLESNDSTEALHGELPWKAVLTIPVLGTDGIERPQRLRLESSLRGLDVQLPWPFGKESGEQKPLRIDIDLLKGIAQRTRIDFGDTLDAEIVAARDDTGKARVLRAEVIFGALAPQFQRRPGFTLSGYIPRLPLGEWGTFLNRSERAAAATGHDMPVEFDVQVSQLELIGQALTDVRLQGNRDADTWQVDISSARTNGTAIIPRDITRDSFVLELDRLHLERRPAVADAGAGSPIDPRRFPALDLQVGDFAYGEVNLGKAEIRTTRRDDGLHLELLRFSGQDFNLSAIGDWAVIDDRQSSRFNIDVSSSALAALLSRFGYDVANIEGGRTEIAINARWPGNPADFALARMDGNFELHVDDGRILDIDPGGGRLFGLLSLQSLPRRLSLDFDDLFGKGFAFDKIDGLFIIESGHAYTNSLFMDGPAARIDVTGRTGLSDQDYDQRVVVTPALSSSIPVAGALFGPIGVGAGAVYFLGQKMFKSIPEQIDRFLSREYVVTGPWDNPNIERI